VLAVIAGFLANPWAIKKALPIFQEGASPLVQWAAYILGPVLILLGIAILLGKVRLAPPTRKILTPALALLCLLGGFANLSMMNGFSTPAYSFEEANERVQESEALLLDGTIGVKRLAKSAMNLALPDHNGRKFFAEDAVLNDLAAGPPTGHGEEIHSLGLEIHHWPIEKKQERISRDEFRMWNPLLERVDYFKKAKFYFVDAWFTNDERTLWHANMGFKALARTKEGKWASIKSQQDVLWRKVRPEEKGIAAWEIYDWKLNDMKISETDEMPFIDVLDQAVPDELTLQRARNSYHEIMTARFLLDTAKPPGEQTFIWPHRYFRPPAQDRHPSVSIVDIDQDGLDDIYVMARWGRNMLFRNRGDGTFEDVATRYGIDVKDHCIGAAFADFDNDGDEDLMLAGSLRRSMYFERRGGRFYDRTAELVDVDMPYLVSAVSCADYDGDGLLDVYFSTYASDVMRTDLMDMRGGGKTMSHAIANRVDNKAIEHGPLANFVSEEDAQHLYKLRTEDEYDYHGYRNAYGPPNILLKNVGGRFVEATESSALRTFRHTYQSTWADYDNDGDPDIYMANDFAPNNFFRNDGDGRFVEVTEETQTADIGFGMSVDWGDYDNDGLQDLYVSNMFSKAGRRITRHIPGVNPIFINMARGNTLFRNKGAGPFERVSGTDDNTLKVEVAGWSWGSGFIDVDNDGWLDIYAINGHYTAPKVIEAQVDI
jgi:hypothetical protein